MREGLAMRIIFCWGLLLGAIWVGPAQAYVGPGLGAGTVGVVLGLIGSGFLALVAVIYYPIKRFFKKRKGKSRAKGDGADA